MHFSAEAVKCLGWYSDVVDVSQEIVNNILELLPSHPLKIFIDRSISGTTKYASLVIGSNLGNWSCSYWKQPKFLDKTL